MDQDSPDNSSLLGFIFGVLAGTAAGILLAPYAGEESRKRLASEAKSLKTRMDDALNDEPFPKVKGKKKKKQLKDLEKSLLGKDKKKKSKKGKKTKDKNDD